MQTGVLLAHFWLVFTKFATQRRGVYGIIHGAALQFFFRKKTYMNKKSNLTFHLKHWNTGVANPIWEPVLIIETTEGQNMTFVMPPQTAIELGKAIQEVGDNLLKTTKKPN
jgi:hypothetical protein